MSLVYIRNSGYTKRNTRTICVCERTGNVYSSEATISIIGTGQMRMRTLGGFTRKWLIPGTICILFWNLRHVLFNVIFLPMFSRLDNDRTGSTCALYLCLRCTPDCLVTLVFKLSRLPVWLSSRVYHLSLDFAWTLFCLLVLMITGFRLLLTD